MLEMGTITDLQIQPLKGGGPLKLEQARMTKSGLETVDGRVKDHGLFVVDASPGEGGVYHFLTQRVQVDRAKNLYVPGTPLLALARPELQDGKLQFTFDGRERIADSEQGRGNPTSIPVQVWEYKGLAIEVPRLSEWLSDNLQRGVKVARTSGLWNRMSRQNFMANDNPLRAQDGYPIHAVTEEDVHAIFKSLGEENVDANRFRYQILFKGLPERGMIHRYDQLSINGIRIDQAKPCDRCEVTGIDQQTGEFSSVKPLAGLAKSGVGRWIREDSGKKAYIVGENWLPSGEAVIKKGDDVSFTRLRATPLLFEVRTNR